LGQADRISRAPNQIVLKNKRMDLQCRRCVRLQHLQQPRHPHRPNATPRQLQLLVGNADNGLGHSACTVLRVLPTHLPQWYNNGSARSPRFRFFSLQGLSYLIQSVKCVCVPPFHSQQAMRGSRAFRTSD
jgi:hypothetical protein